METPRRQFLRIAAGTAVLPALSRIAAAQAGPARPKAGTRVITVGTTAGPPPRAHRAQASNLLIVNGSFYVIDAGDGAARRIAKAGINVRDIGTPFQVRSATVQHRRHGGVNGRGKYTTRQSLAGETVSLKGARCARIASGD